MRDRLLTSTDTVGRLAGIPIVTQVVNATNKSATGRRLMEKMLDVHHERHPAAVSQQDITKAARLRVMYAGMTA